MIPVARLAALLLPAIAVVGMDEQAPVPMRDVSIRGSAVAAPGGGGGTVDLVIQSVIGTPIGRIPISGHMRLVYDCDAAFRGRMSYNPIVRLFAKIKGVDLIRTVNGRLESDDAARAECPALQAANIVGAAKTDSMTLSGFVRLDQDSVRFRGPTWMSGDSAYHAMLGSERQGRQLTLHVNMYER